MADKGMIEVDDLRVRYTRVAWYRPLRPADERGEQTDDRFGLLRIHDEPGLEVISRQAFERLEQAFGFIDTETPDESESALDPHAPGQGI